MTKFEMMVKKALKKENKEKVLEVWNKYQNEWVGNSERYLTTKQLYDEFKTNRREMNRAKKCDRSLADFNADKKYVVVYSNGYIKSVSRFYSDEFVNLEFEDFLNDVAEYSIELGLGVLVY